MFVIEFSFRFCKEKGLDAEPPVLYDVSSGQIERSERSVGFSPNEGWEDKR